MSGTESADNSPPRWVLHVLRVVTGMAYVMSPDKTTQAVATFQSSAEPFKSMQSTDCTFQHNRVTADEGRVDSPRVSSPARTDHDSEPS